MNTISGEQKSQEKWLPLVWKSNSLDSTKSNINLVNSLLQERVPGKWFELGKEELDLNGNYEKAKYYFNKEVFCNSTHWQSHFLLSYLYIVSTDNNINLSCKHLIAAADSTVHKTFWELWRFDDQYPEYLDFLYLFYTHEIETKIFKDKDIDEVLKIEGNDELLLGLLMASHFNRSSIPDLLYYIEAYNRCKPIRNWFLCFIEGRYKTYWRKYLLEAIEAFNITIQQRPNYAMAYINRANAYHYLIRFGRNKDELAVGFELNAEDIYAIRLSAIEDLSRALELDPEVAYVLQMRGEQRVLIGDYINAIDDFTFLIEDSSNDPQSYKYFDRARVKIRIEDFDGAVQDLTTGIIINNSHFGLVEAFYLRAEVSMMQNKIKQAIDDYSNAIQSSNECAIAFYKRALAKQIMGDNAGYESDMIEYRKLKDLDETREIKMNSYNWINLWGNEVY